MRFKDLRRPIWGPLKRRRPRPPDRTDPDDVQPPPLDAGPPVAPVVVPQWIQLVILPLAVLALWALARAAGTIFLILLIAMVVALILNPLAKLYQRAMPRGLSIFAVYLTVFALLAGVGALVSSPIASQVNHFANTVPHLAKHANHELDQLQRWLNRNGIKVHIEAQGQTALQTLEKNVEKSSGSIVSFSRDLLSDIVTTGIDIVLTLVLSVYLLVYAKEIGDLVRRVMPAGDGTPEDDYPLLVQKAVSGYVRGQLLFSLIMGSSAAILLWLLGVTDVFPDGSRYALFFGVFYGLMELVPYIGPIIGPVPAILVALFTNPISAVWVLIVFVGLQQLEGHLVAPQVFRISLRINPILVILSLLIGYQIYGVAGALVALPLATITRATVLYLRAHLILEPWSTMRPPFGGHGFAPDPCPECGAQRQPDDGFCRSCGAALSRDEVSAYRQSP